MIGEALAALLFGLGMLAFAFGMARRRKATPKEVLENPVRRSLWERIMRRPGTRQRDLYESGEPRGTIHYHVKLLVRAKALQANHEWGITRYYPPTMDAHDIRLRNLLLRGRVLEFVREVIAEPGVSQDKLYHERRLSRKVLRVYVPMLVEEGLLRVERGTTTKYFHPTEELKNLVARIDEGGTVAEPVEWDK